MKKSEVNKFLTRISVSSRFFRYANEPDMTQDVIAAQWFDMLKPYELADCIDVLDRLMADESRKEAAPTASEMLRALRSKTRSVSSMSCSPEAFAAVVEEGNRSGMVLCKFRTRDNRNIVRWERRTRAVFDGANWWPKIEFALRWLEPSEVNQAINSIGIIGINDVSDPELGAKYLVLLEELTSRAFDAKLSHDEKNRKASKARETESLPFESAGAGEGGL